MQEWHHVGRTMRLEWIEDILAVIDTGSLARAADRRLRTQSAFSRRLNALEAYLGNPLFDRSIKPLRPLPVVFEHEAELRDLAERLRQIEKSLGAKSGKNRRKLTIVSPQSLATTHAPRLVQLIHHRFDIGVNVQSSDRDTCIMALLSGEADLGIFFRPVEEDKILSRIDVEVVSIGADSFIPVATPQTREHLTAPQSTCPVIAYPKGVFFGQLVNIRLIPELAKTHHPEVVVESELTHAVLQLVLQGTGMGWLPQSLVRDHLAKGELVDLSDSFPHAGFQVVLVRAVQSNRPDIDEVWQALLESLRREALS
ncbi:LysR family transcriptional regulator [Candidatus Halocynthiibacter alkanivorans]|uniref:LysR family transcriptional regulator n=1 Tax=Candidatus Halocynthiibacter alkanivorans TaxID=2267619 RepID=UPI000DF15C3A|nr:LysR family transcriptional regulator [Candidatus Halocynthiibacter alkanivorans]